jgi:hypothetical protein
VSQKWTQRVYKVWVWYRLPGDRDDRTEVIEVCASSPTNASWIACAGRAGNLAHPQLQLRHIKVYAKQEGP